MFFLAFPLLFLAGYTEGFHSNGLGFCGLRRISKSMLFLAHPNSNRLNETVEIEMAKRRMKEKMQKKHFPYSKRYFENSLKRINRLLSNPNRFEKPEKDKDKEKSKARKKVRKK